jgi:hypothetical protein
VRSLIAQHSGPDRNSHQPTSSRLTVKHDEAAIAAAFINVAQRRITFGHGQFHLVDLPSPT